MDAGFASGWYRSNRYMVVAPEGLIFWAEVQMDRSSLAASSTIASGFVMHSKGARPKGQPGHTRLVEDHYFLTVRQELSA
jgi:hypothetical protein